MLGVVVSLLVLRLAGGQPDASVSEPCLACKGVSGAPARPSLGGPARVLDVAVGRGAAGAPGPGRPALSLFASAIERRRLVALSLRLAGEVDAIGVVDDAVEDGIGDGGLANDLRPARGSARR